MVIATGTFCAPEGTFTGLGHRETNIIGISGDVGPPLTAHCSVVVAIVAASRRSKLLSGVEERRRW